MSMHSPGNTPQNSGAQPIHQRAARVVHQALIGVAGLAVVWTAIWLLDQGVFQRFFELRSDRAGRELSDRAWTLLLLILVFVSVAVFMVNNLRRRIHWWQMSAIVVGIFAVAYMLGRTSMQLDYDFLLRGDFATTLTTWAAFGLLLGLLAAAGSIGWFARRR